MVPIGIANRLNTALTIVIIRPQAFPTSSPMPPATDKPIKHKRIRLAILKPNMAPTSGPKETGQLRPRALGKAKSAIA